MILKTLLIAVAGGIVFTIIMVVINVLRVNRFRAEAENGFPCSVYHDECLCRGKIEERVGDRIEVKYTDDSGREYLRVFQIDEIYPAW